MSDLADEDIYREVGKIVSQFDLYQCYDSAIAVMQWLRDNRIEGRIIELKTFYRDEDYIVSDRIGGDESISENGKHYGVRVCGLIFDNLSTIGMKEADWIRDFHCPSNEFEIAELGE
ncbi:MULTISPECIES: papain fold toxin domain-containing protein [unclassified Chamaesiphon]|uniref:papain fold toxin domain-containing protein n=1 Tax=unclassified Chamaesiphon TaxID=2620921 RepID=UPI00286CA4DF|nr:MULTISPECIES: papain fold toxin domain-containing protein [unclassified Chamaesiphon]